MKRSGWRGESYRHYLAAKGVKTTVPNKYFAREFSLFEPITPKPGIPDTFSDYVDRASRAKIDELRINRIDSQILALRQNRQKMLEELQVHSRLPDFSRSAKANELQDLVARSIRREEYLEASKRNLIAQERAEREERALLGEKLRQDVERELPQKARPLFERVFPEPLKSSELKEASWEVELAKRRDQAHLRSLMPTQYKIDAARRELLEQERGRASFEADQKGLGK
jgi:hypothetical protein